MFIYVLVDPTLNLEDCTSLLTNLNGNDVEPSRICVLIACYTNIIFFFSIPSRPDHFVSVSRVERSSDQVIKPVNLEALSKWVGQIPEDVVRDMADIAPMLSVLGYDPYANPPAYGSPDSSVADNTYRIKAEARLWQDKANDLLSPQKSFADAGAAAPDVEESASAPPAPPPAA